jgi:hypothetical protein
MIISKPALNYNKLTGRYFTGVCITVNIIEIYETKFCLVKIMSGQSVEVSVAISLLNESADGGDVRTEMGRDDQGKVRRRNRF